MTEHERVVEALKQAFSVPHDELPPPSERLQRALDKLARDRQLTQEEIDRPCTI